MASGTRGDLYKRAVWLGHNLVGVSLLAIAVCHSTLCRLKYHYREQAHSYKGIAYRAGSLADGRSR
ncbi:hypothetical protein EMIT0347P_50258 [Pseudomonas sp. IT-347P]